MNTVIFKFFCILFLSSIITLIIPEGKMGKIVNKSLYLLTILALISPFFSLNINNEFKIESNLNNSSFIIDYLYNVKENREEQLNNNINQLLNENGFKNNKVYSNIELNDNNQYFIQKIKIEIDKNVIDEKNENIDIKEKIFNLILSQLKVEESVIEVLINE